MHQEIKGIKGLEKYTNFTTLILYYTIIQEKKGTQALKKKITKSNISCKLKKPDLAVDERLRELPYNKEIKKSVSLCYSPSLPNSNQHLK
ncbi:hypothetical protein QVD17_30353 [Tagetes erecta]|uniref:Uncharacterized protein n=1 Tax=Tagetes erecta TaxID=13708 RepID=A0AAD8K1D4_TARER|nr:hypothetical protein QVD17_30353 [Tagetes erecta]